MTPRGEAGPDPMTSAVVESRAGAGVSPPPERAPRGHSPQPGASGTPASGLTPLTRGCPSPAGTRAEPWESPGAGPTGAGGARTRPPAEWGPEPGCAPSAPNPAASLMRKLRGRGPRTAVPAPVATFFSVTSQPPFGALRLR